MLCSEIDGKITISITEKKEVIEVQIHNNGKGIKEEEFQPYLISSISRNQNVKKPIGGLGLAICKQIIEHHKGTFGSKAH
jgi:signal transduction histidine kinase